MNNRDVAGVLQTYAEKASKARNTKHLREIITDLKHELDLRSIKMDKDRGDEC